MTSSSAPPPAAPPALSKLVKTTAIAIAVAAVILIAIVLPAEYGIDPLGTGRRLGLTAIASPPLAVSESAGDATLRPTVNGPIGDYPAEYKFDVFDITLAPYDYVEYKYRLEQGATMVYSWKAGAAVLHDQHGERAAPQTGEAPEESFDTRARRQASGAFTAPFSGLHGWYWENPGGDPVTIRLTSAGFYSAAVEIRSDRTKHHHPLQTPAVWPVPTAPAGAGK